MSTQIERMIPLDAADLALIAPLEKQVRNSPRNVHVVMSIMGALMLLVLYISDAHWGVSLIFGIFMLVFMLIASAAMREFVNKLNKDLLIKQKLVVTGRLMDAFELQKSSKDPRVLPLQIQMMQSGTTRYYWQVGERYIPLQEDLYAKGKIGDLVSVSILAHSQQTFNVEPGWTDHLEEAGLPGK